MRPLVDLLHEDTEAVMAFDGVLPPLNPRALPGRLDSLTPWHTRTPRNASWTDSPLRAPRFRRLWGNRNRGSLSGRHSVGANRPDVTVRSGPGLHLLQACPPCRPSNGPSVHLHGDWGQRADQLASKSSAIGCTPLALLVVLVVARHVVDAAHLWGQQITNADG